MNLSHKLTFSLFSVLLIVGCAFLVTPAMAHETTTTAGGGTTFDEIHDGLADDGTALTAASTPTLDSETGHTHKTSVPTATLTLQDNMVGTDSSVSGAEARLIANLTADPLAFTDLAATSTDTGVFQILVTFSEAVYNNADTTTTVDALTAADADLVAGDFTLTAALQSAPTANIAGAGISITSIARTPSTTAFLVTLTVTNAIIQAESLPIDLWISVNANALQTASSGPVLNNGVEETNLGRGNAASMRYKFTVVASFDTTAPTLTVPAGTRGDDGNVTFTITADEELSAGSGALTTDDLMVTGGEIVSLTQDGMVYTLVVMPTDMYTDVSVTITAAGVMDRASNAVAADVTAMYDAPARPITLPDGDIVIPANSFVIVVRNADSTQPGAGGLAFRSDIMTAEWAGMPDLQYLFDRTAPHGGGAIILSDTGSSLTVGQVGISEIMWALDNSYLGNETAQQASQWIELQNLTGNEVTVRLSTLMGTAITDAANGLRGDLAAPNIDAVTNFFNNRPGHGAWDVKGSSGDSVQARNFVSMSRILPNKKSKYEDADGSRFNNRDGRHVNHWQVSSNTYLISRTSGGAEFKYIGTPGRVNNFTPAKQPDLVVGRTGVATNDIYINEVGNSSNNNHDWIELAGPAGKNLRNYLISIVTDNTADNILIQFDANDNAKIAANGHFLILRTDPADDPDHPIAATGFNVDKTNEEQQPGTPNSPVRYKVFTGGTRGALNLPNDGKFVLIVRRPDNHEGHRSGAHNDKGVAERGNADLDKVVDVAGWDDNVGKNQYPNAVSNTGLWPLHSFGGPFTNRNAFWQDTVHRRQYRTTNDGRSGIGAHENRNQDDRAAFRDIGWLGVGYKRGVAQNAMNGGTPGYPNNALDAAGDAIRAAVYISEIMYADDDRGSLAQWIEIRNPSATLGADLHNWRLTITNHDSKNEAGDEYIGRGSGFVLLRGLKIKPNSSVLITSRKGPRDDVHLPVDDIFVLFPQRRGDFSMTNATSDILNPYGFNITLHANAHDNNKPQDWRLVDELGNLAERRTAGRAERTDTERYDAPRWMWPNGLTEDGMRVSVARANAYGGSKATGFTRASGKEASGWILSSMDRRTDLISPTYYGHRDDISTPGQTVGQPLPVQLSYFRPTLENGKVTIQWTTESELDNAGFNILRSETRDGEFTQVNEQMIQGNGTTAERTTYKWVDTTAKPGAVYYYQIEDVSFAGEHTKLATTKLKGLISAKGKRTLQWGDLKNLR